MAVIRHPFFTPLAHYSHDFLIVQHDQQFNNAFIANGALVPLSYSMNARWLTPIRPGMSSCVIRRFSLASTKEWAPRSFFSRGSDLRSHGLFLPSIGRLLLDVVVTPSINCAITNRKRACPGFPKRLTTFEANCSAEMTSACASL
jgi:hypothetical protein